ncbi:P0560B06.4 [Oryza sativa Japonica Group]|uniref:p0560B06.4 protein n=1 Tax=Oryza sativa subsp. japonica TaxID=39947 RepID=Q942T8_ORYSJ|nr:P0560B06.4 [Oryza sativa Japonica Group]
MAVSASEGVGQYDLLIVGPGVLGRIVAERWQQDSPCVPIGRSPRTDVLLKAENAVLEAGGSVLRLDAASLAIAIMKRRLRARVFVGCDNQPLSRQEIMDLVNRSGKFDTKFQGFTGTDGPLGKRMENSKTRAEIGWQPKYPSFTEFLGLSN